MNLAEELRAVPVFADLPAGDLDWLASQMTPVDLAPGEIFIREGSPADRMVVLLDGEMRLRIESGNGETTTRILRGPLVGGLLPYSRMTHVPATFRAVTQAHGATLPAELFPEMLARIPVLGPRLVALLSDRIRDFTRLQDHQEKMAALGKISAGLAHELNNPAAAARRAVSSLREAFQTFRDAAARLDAHPLSSVQRAAVPALERELAQRAVTPAPMDSLERSDCEETIAACLLRHGVSHAWDLAPALVDAGCEAAWFDRVYAQFPAGAWPDFLARAAASLTIGALLDQIENSTGRISDLVHAIKEYTYMDQGPDQEVDIHQGLESTLLMLRHRLKHGIDLKLDFDRTLPKICARGSELNQVWTNLIDNAIDAMDGKGELRIRTARELDHILVEIADNGPGIPPEVQSHIFEPFFTTKGVGQGTGLGLETVRRILQEHSGEITVQSVPGDTRFQIRLPLQSEATP
ncbi:MAG TPA: ATP-binding protein [Bryobacteraceae bacterium]|jgi:signal transduction histidine kinase|nr:ATP-binding protein [Bryobacteraceae bacterium]